MDKDERRKTGLDEGSLTAGPDPPLVEDVSDPEEDNLDGLDDMLDEFSATRNDAPEEASKKEGYSSADPMEKQRASYEVTNDFSKQLQEQMAALMGSVDESPEMKQEIEAMLQELGTAPDTALSGDKSHPPSAAAAARSPEQPSAIEEPFQETIRKTMERIQASGEKATTAAKSEGSDEMLAGMLKEMQNSGSESTGDDEGFNKMLMGMMEQLTNKDILYDPMKELHDKFPTWMAKNRAETGQEDLKRYEEQQKLVKEIVCRFEQPDYSDSKTADREYIVERMQLMQSAGSPPADLVGNMHSAQDALSSIEPGCAPQ